MDTVASLLFISTLLQPVLSAAQLESQFQAVAEMVSGESRIFSGEEARLRCSVPADHMSSWNFLWFKGSRPARQAGRDLVLWNAHITDSGKYYCKGVRSTAVGDVETILSPPVEIAVDGGFAILQVPPHPGLVGQTLSLTCRVRQNPPLHQVILYKDQVPVLTQNGPSPHVELTNLSLEDQGSYSCRASWNWKRSTRSVLSVPVSVQVLEMLTQPVLRIEPESNQWLALTCELQYNAPDPAPPINYYFYKDGERLGPARSQNKDLVRTGPGDYSCRAKVPALGIYRWSEPIGFGQAAGPELTEVPRVPQPRGFVLEKLHRLPTTARPDPSASGDEGVDSEDM